MSEKQHLEPHERRDVNVRQVALAGCGLMVGTALILGLMAALLFFLVAERTAEEGMAPARAEATPRPAPAPGLQVAPAQAWLELQATEAAHLHTYGWLNEEAGVARIPIERAMALLLERGLPTPAPSATPAAAPTSTGEAEE